MDLNLNNFYRWIVLIFPWWKERQQKKCTIIKDTKTTIFFYCKLSVQRRIYSCQCGVCIYACVYGRISSDEEYLLSGFVMTDRSWFELTHLLCATMFIDLILGWVHSQTPEQITNFEGIDISVTTVPEIKQVEHLTYLWKKKMTNSIVKDLTLVNIKHRDVYITMNSRSQCTKQMTFKLFNSNKFFF